MMLVRLSTALVMKPLPILGAVRLLTVPHTQKGGRRVEGEGNTKNHHNPTPYSPSSVHSRFDPERSSNPSDRAPHEFTSGDYNRSGPRTTEYSNVDKEEPYSPPGGQHRYGGAKNYEWNAERIEKESQESKDGGKNAKDGGENAKDGGKNAKEGGKNA